MKKKLVNIRQLSRHTYAVRALTDIEDFNQQFNTHFADEEVIPLGGGHASLWLLTKTRWRNTIENIGFKVTSAIVVVWFNYGLTVTDEQLAEIEKPKNQRKIKQSIIEDDHE